MKVELTLIEEMLGTKAANKDVFADFIASKHPSGTPQKDELDNAEHREEAGTTIFHRMKQSLLTVLAEDKGPFISPKDDPDIIGLYDYQIKGFFKDACGAINRFGGEEGDELRKGPSGKVLEKLPAYKTKIDGCIFVGPRFIPIMLPNGGAVGICERPLRAETAQGPRVSLCRSETVPVGSKIVCDITILSVELKNYVKIWLDYGEYRGLGQWRNSGKGRFTWAGVK